MNQFNNSDYEILSPLGRGGMGEVYLAKDRRLQRQVAIKFLREDLAVTDWRDKLSTEAVRLAQLNHPNIVQIYDVVKHDDSLALIMEYVDGRNLHIHLREQSADLQQRMGWLAQISSALAESHRVDIAHCDLKAENVLISSDGVAKVSDFGISSVGANIPDDLLALGKLAQRLLADAREVPAAANHLIARLSDQDATQRPSSDEAARDFRQILMAVMSPAELTPFPAPLAIQRHSGTSVRLVIFGLLMVVGLASISYLMREPPPQHYVAVLPPKLGKGSGLPEQQLLDLQATIAQSLQSIVIDSEELSLISARETATLRGTPSEIAQTPGVGSLLSSILTCNTSACGLSIERLGGPEGAVIQQREVVLYVDSPLESHDSLQRQWNHLFPAIAPLRRASDAIEEEDYKQYLNVYLGVKDNTMPTGEALSQLEELLLTTERFLPLYRLYTDVAMAQYDFSGDIAHLNRLEQVLYKAELGAESSPFLLQGKFDLAMARQDYDQAQQIIGTVDSISRDELMALEFTGRLQHIKGDYAEADKYYSRAQAKRPSLNILYSRAKNYYYWGRLNDSLETAEKLLELYPNSTKAHNLKSGIYMERGELNKAISVSLTSLAIQPDPIQRSNLGLAYMLQGDYERAREQLETAFNNSRDHGVMLNLADVEQLLGNEMRATDLYQNLIRKSIEIDYSIPLEIVAQAHAQLGQYEQAMLTLDKIVGGKDETVDYAFTASLVYSLGGQNVLALAEVERAVESGISPVWFDLPWFDPLCRDTGFERLLEQAGAPNRCADVRAPQKQGESS